MEWLAEQLFANVASSGLSIPAIEERFELEYHLWSTLILGIAGKMKADSLSAKLNEVVDYDRITGYIRRSKFEHMGQRRNFSICFTDRNRLFTLLAQGKINVPRQLHT
ncbi:hypothetical protein AVEN_4064-1 [Araneus ventricosus]|uniref:Uncharacterized protein n=1 Tax=Araneus ventricosus TaxID=182803 RepID=A0A4Y2MCH7_ARAVE|nr:hypothetical protein AVEN_4064-1 [Araneus ventricosus]